MKNFLAALQFLTILPIKARHAEKNLAGAMMYFPFVGLFIGLVLAGLDKFLIMSGFDPFVINITLIVLLVLVTGGLHCDGLADTADALLSRKDKNQMLVLMRDPHIGVMGVLSLICVVLLKIAFLSSVSIFLKSSSLVLMCVLSRWSLVYAMYVFPYARPEGKAKIFKMGINLKIFLLATIAALACSIIVLGTMGLVLFAICAVGAFLVNRSFNRQLGGITGDTLGATCELIELTVLFSIAILGRFDLWMI